MVKINLLTYLTFNLNMLVDKGKGIPLKETKQLCEQRTILRELQERFPFAETNLDLSLLKLQPDAEEELENIFYYMAISLKDSEMCVANNGLCLFLGFENYENKFKRLPMIMADLDRRNQKSGFMQIDLSDPVKVTVQQRNILAPSEAARVKARYKT